jgi:hypothetical protein
MFRIIALVAFAVLCLPFMAFADAVVVVAEPTFLDGVLKFLAALDPAVVGVAVAIVEAGLRLLPTGKAASVLVPVNYVLKGLIVIATVLQTLTGKLIESGNNLKPQA